jgi:hypothetical protein
VAIIFFWRESLAIYSHFSVDEIARLLPISRCYPSFLDENTQIWINNYTFIHDLDVSSSRMDESGSCTVVKIACALILIGEKKITAGDPTAEECALWSMDHQKVVVLHDRGDARVTWREWARLASDGILKWFHVPLADVACLLVAGIYRGRRLAGAMVPRGADLRKGNMSFLPYS